MDDRSCDPNDAAWVAHLRWAMEHLQHRYDAAGQSAWALVGLQGVFVALVAPVAVAFDGAARWLAFVTMLCLGAGAGRVIVGMFPKSIESINVSNYRNLWKSSTGDKRIDRLEGLFVEELLQSGGAMSPLDSLSQLTEARFASVKAGALLTVAAIAFLVISVFVQMVD